ncbi:MAG: hypothetical protein U5O39_16465 [Gammaproteobacteria bacterium]|nr:hypothetical protein [Gammaproteobacteria bacterium]
MRSRDSCSIRRFDNIQASWTKLGHEGVKACLNAGVNDLGGTLMNETITRAAGASHGQETSPEKMEAMIRSAGRTPVQRTTDYGKPAELQVQTLLRREGPDRSGLYIGKTLRTHETGRQTRAVSAGPGAARREPRRGRANFRRRHRLGTL